MCTISPATTKLAAFHSQVTMGSFAETSQTHNPSSPQGSVQACAMAQFRGCLHFAQTQRSPHEGPGLGTRCQPSHSSFTQTKHQGRAQEVAGLHTLPVPAGPHQLQSQWGHTRGTGAGQLCWLVLGLSQLCWCTGKATVLGILC